MINLAKYPLVRIHHYCEPRAEKIVVFLRWQEAVVRPHSLEYAGRRASRSASLRFLDKDLYTLERGNSIA
jgi:hypothetical protein